MLNIVIIFFKEMPDMYYCCCHISEEEIDDTENSIIYDTDIIYDFGDNNFIDKFDWYYREFCQLLFQGNVYCDDFTNLINCLISYEEEIRTLTDSELVTIAHYYHYDINVLMIKYREKKNNQLKF
jgi:hypothetical protein